MMKDIMSPFAKTELSRARVNYMFEIRLTWEGVGIPTRLSSFGALQLWHLKLIGQRLPEQDSTHQSFSR